MKRAFFGVIWFFALAFLGFVGGGAVVGVMAGSKVQATNVADGYTKGRDAGSIVGAEFGRNYGGVIVLAPSCFPLPAQCWGFCLAPGDAEIPAMRWPDQPSAATPARTDVGTVAYPSLFGLGVTAYTVMRDERSADP